MPPVLHLLAGPLALPDLLSQILRDRPVGGKVTLPGWQLVSLDDGPLPLTLSSPGETLSALGLELLPDQAETLNFVTQALGLTTLDLPQPDGRLFRLYQGLATLPADSSRTPWHDRWHIVLRHWIADILGLRGQLPVAEIAQRHNAMLVRAAGRARAEAQPRAPAPGYTAQPQDVQVQAQSVPYSAFFAVQEYDLAWRRFDGSLSQPAPRAVFLSGDAVTVLPYDPQRDCVLLVEQFRAGPFARGDRQPWQIETIAGRIDPGETPEQSARREAVEEAGLELAGLLPVAQYYPTPGANTEFLYSYVALTDLPPEKAGLFGLETEAEDIRTHILPFAEMMRLVTLGTIANAPLILTALWLERERPRLRAAKP